MKKGHRLVVLPDYQGIGVGRTLQEFVAEYYTKQGYRFRSQTSNPALIKSLKRNKNWLLKRIGRVSGGSNTVDKALQRTFSNARITTSWEYKRT